MTFEEFDALQKTLLDKVIGMTETKGKDYARSDEDRLANFKRAGANRKVAPEQALGIFLDKHADAINSYLDRSLKGDFSEGSEPIEGRFVDVITYYTLLWGLVVERRGNWVAERDEVEMRGEMKVRVYDTD